MKYIYYYRTSDGVRREGEIDTPTRDEAFTALRARGIRPIKVKAADGSFENGAARGGVRRRFVVLIALFTAVVVFGVALFFGKFVNRGGNGGGDNAAVHQGIARKMIESEVVQIKLNRGERVASSRARRYIAPLVDKIGTTNFFARASENALACFAMPGETPKNIPEVSVSLTEDFYESLGEDIVVKANDTPSVAELKGIVVRLKEEAEIYLRTGRGLADYFAYLRQRQKMEAGYRQSIIHDYSPEEASKLLMSMGFRPLDQ